uniref:C2H2-type domain-containing protein n=1 Tax=Knipowitschia caucasica TaxID=637954 RepID=A0AAV2MQU0_KNICA
MDFSIIAKRTDRTTGIYKCNYCKKKIFGIKKICKHLDTHRKRLLEKQRKVSEQQTLPSLNSLAENAVSASNEGTVVSPAAASLSNEKPESRDNAHICQRCKRLFKSLKGLRSHERSHAALAALDHATTSESNENVDQYITYRNGTTRPFMCTLCSYRTTMSSLAKSHVVKQHTYLLTPKVERLFDEATQKDNEEASSNNADDMNAEDDELQNSFLEPPDVQRQLKNYNVMARIDLASKTQDLRLREPRMLPCEMCNFNCKHYSAMRRHCLRRHGKKLIRCKDCNFFSCFKRNLDLHEQMGHSTLQSEPTHQKNLCCPFCLYQSKNKNNMIDHIILHREERVIPMEVRRSKLSRYLQGVVFRCHKCTFSSGSADALHSHVAKHNDLKPFKCRLCYFDCSQMKDLEAHLWDKHQVVRNHQLVGQVSLDQLEAREDRISQDDEEEDMKAMMLLLHCLRQTELLFLLQSQRICSLVTIVGEVSQTTQNFSVT